MNFQSILLVALGSALGGSLRYLASLSMGLLVNNPKHYHATFFVNIVGSLCIGIMYALINKLNINQQIQLFIMVGLFGGFTTFSSFSLDNLKLLQDGAIFEAFLYSLSSIVLGLIAVFAGYYLTTTVIQT